jgi:hypothetical protein
MYVAMIHLCRMSDTNGVNGLAQLMSSYLLQQQQQQQQHQHSFSQSTITPQMLAALGMSIPPLQLSPNGNAVPVVFPSTSPPPPPPPQLSPTTPTNVHQPVTIPASSPQREHYKSVIECGLPNPDKPGNHQHTPHHTCLPLTTAPSLMRCHRNFNSHMMVYGQVVELWVILNHSLVKW